MRMVLAILALAAWTGAATAENLAACRNSVRPLNDRPPTPDLSGTLPIPDYLDIIVACNTGGPGGGFPAPPRPRSAWFETEQKIYSDALSRTKADVLVVPLQIQGRGLDRIERGLMAADLAYAIGDAGSLVVADPFLTALALGDGARSIYMEAAEQLAQRMGARWIVAGYVGHDGNHKFTLTVQVIDAKRSTAGTAAAQRWQHDWRAIAFSDEKTPSLEFHDLLPTVVQTLPLGLSGKKQVTLTAASTPGAMATTPLEAVKAQAKQSSSPAATLLLLAALAPPGEERTRERLFERALIASMRTNSPDLTSTFVEAYALMGLERRPGALARIARQSLNDDSAAAFQSLRELLNGNLNSAKVSVAKVKDPFRQFLLQLGLRDLELEYSQDDLTKITALATLFRDSQPSWAPLLTSRVSDLDVWHTAQALELKESLDEAFPSRGLDVASVVRGGAVARGETADEVEIDIAIGRHLRGAISRLDIAECCRPGSLHANEWDLLWLLQADSERRIDKTLYRATHVYRLPERAIATVNRYEPFFSGHPMLGVASAEASSVIASKSPDDERAPWQQRARRDGVAAIWWVQNQSGLAARAALTLGIPSPDTNLWVDGYGHDYPLRPSWPRRFISVWPPDSPEILAATAEALAFSRTSVDPLLELRAAGKWPTSKEAISAIGGPRFAGNPRERAAFADKTPAQPIPVAEQLAAMKQSAKENPNDWEPHYTLGLTLLESGASFQAAQAAFLGYAGFRDHNARNAAAVSNWAYQAAKLLYEQGQPDLARPLFQISADLDTGSSGSLTSVYRLELLDRHYRDAAEHLLARGQRFPSANAYNDYFSILHALGAHEAAWAGFSQLRAQFELPQTWMAALVGHRMEGLDEAGMKAWVKGPEIRSARFKEQQFASWYAVLWSSTDRLPPTDLGALVEELEGAPIAHVGKDGITTLRAHPGDPTRFDMVFHSVPLVGPPHKLEPGTALKSERAYFADAYSAVGRGDYAVAVQRFNALLDHYPLNGPVLSYLAYAASKTDTDVKTAIRIPSFDVLPEDDFDARLARAFYASRKDVAEARKLLGLALRVRPDNDDRPVLVEFQYAQACEWLLKDTRDDAFRTMLLDWVKANQRIQPSQGWAYAMQYTYETDPAERVRALAMTRYLDPSSPRIQKVPAAELAKAKAWWRDHNPFAEKQAGESQPQI